MLAPKHSVALLGAAMLGGYIRYRFSSSTSELQLFGVNQSGGEFGMNTFTGQVVGEYTWPAESSLDYMQNRGFDLIRLPFAWERLQPYGIDTDFDYEYIMGLKAAVWSITTRGMYVNIEPHNYARFHGVIVSPRQLADLWSRLATIFVQNGKVQFGIMNEPHDIDAGTWYAIAQAGVDAIRATNATNRITVPGINWTSAVRWTVDNPGIAITDPVQNTLYEMHQYFDYDYSGTHTDCSVSPTIAFTQTTAWLRANKQRAYLGEFAVANNAQCLDTLQTVLLFLQDNSDVWIQATYWAAGQWWGSYFLSVEPPANANILARLAQVPKSGIKPLPTPKTTPDNPTVDPYVGVGNSTIIPQVPAGAPTFPPGCTTYRGPQMIGIVGQCGFRGFQYDDDYIVGVSDNIFGTARDGVQTPVCGECITVTAPSGLQATGMIGDRIPNSINQYDLPATMYYMLGGQNLQNVTVNIVPCNARIETMKGQGNVYNPSIVSLSTKPSELATVVDKSILLFRNLTAALVAYRDEL